MNQLIDPAKSGLALGALLGGWNLLWSILVLIHIPSSTVSGGIPLAQYLINLFLWAHMVNIPIAVNTFDFSVAIVLILLTAIIGYALGYLFATIWNRMHRDVVVQMPQSENAQ